MGPARIAPGVPLQPVTSLVGRDLEAEEVLHRLGQAALMTLTGPPGVGKSRLALEVSDRLHRGGSPGAVVVSVERLSRARQLAPAVDRALEERLTPLAGSDGPVVILDDCDRLLSACADVAYALMCRGLRTLATSREPLQVEGESVWRVRPLRVPQAHLEELPDVFTESAAVQLFCERAALAERGFLPTAETTPAIAEICRRLDGVPLAIELAARTVTSYSPAEILARLDAPFALLAHGPRTAHPRHQNLWASLAWSYDLLSAPQRVLLEGLAIFPGSFSEDAAFQVCAPEGMAQVEAAEILRALVEKSLVEVDSHTGATRYRLLHMVRWFEAKKLGGGEEQRRREQHARWATELVQAAGDARRGRAWLERLEPYHDDVHAVMEWALTSGEGETAVMLGLTDVRLCRARERYRAARKLAQELAAVAARPALHAQALTAAGIANAAAGDMGAALANLEEAVAVAEGAGDPTESRRARLVLASTRVVKSGRAAVPSLERVLSEPGDAGDPYLLVDGLAALGRAALLVGDPARAHDDFTRASQLAGDATDEVGLAGALVGLGCAAMTLGQYEDAEAHLGEGLKLAQTIGEVEDACLALSSLGETARLKGDAEGAETSFVRAVELAVTAELPGARAQALLGLGRIAEGRGDKSSAQELFETALATAQTASVTCLVAPSLCGMAQLADDPVTARSLLTEALAAAQAFGDRAGEALALDHLARVREAQGDLSGAAAGHRHALALRGEIGDPAAIAYSLEALAALAAARGAFSGAPRLLGAAEALRERHGCARPLSQCADYASVVQCVREALGEKVFSAERRHGAGLSYKGALAHAVRHGGRRALRADAGWGALTAAERRVAELAAQGRTNSDIGHQLGIAPATVKAHLRSAFAKVGVRNRTALAAALHATDEPQRMSPQA